MVFKAAIDAGLWGPAVIGLVGSVVAAFYYLRLIKVMWFDGSVGVTERTAYILRVRQLAVALAKAYVEGMKGAEA